MNSQWFSRKEVEKGLHLQFIKNLSDISNAKENGYFEILISSDGESICVEWLERDYKGEDCEGRFAHLDYDEVIMKEVHFPDNHYEYLLPEEVDEVFNEWLKEHPNYKQNKYGIWQDTNEIVDYTQPTENYKQMSLEDFGIEI